MRAQVLCIGQSDSSAGTGIQADIKTVMAHRGYAASVITAVCAQNTRRIHDIHLVPPGHVGTQIAAALEDFTINVIKTGMMGDAETINQVADILDRLSRNITVVCDPVITGRSGAILLDKPARDALKRRLMLRADVITPNIAEAQELTGVDIYDASDMQHAAEMLLTLGAQSVVLTGGAIEGDKICDIVADEDGCEMFEHPRINTTSTHGAGTTLAAAIAANRGRGISNIDSYIRARDYVARAIESASRDPLGEGFGPLDHFVGPEGEEPEDRV